MSLVLASRPPNEASCTRWNEAPKSSPLCGPPGATVDRDSNGHPGAVRKAGFRYVTLQGHPECGIASFEVRSGPKGEVTILLDARSRPGSWLTRLGRPFARRFQQTMTRAALRRLADDGQR